MTTSSNGNIFLVIVGPLWGESTGHRWIPFTKAMTRSFEIYFDLRLNKRLSKHSRRWWCETPSRSLWRHCNVICIDGPPSSCHGAFLDAVFRHIHFITTIGTMNNTSDFGGRKWNRLFDHQGWVQNHPRTTENYSNFYFAFKKKYTNCVTHWNTIQYAIPMLLCTVCTWFPYENEQYRQVSNISRTLVGNKIVDHSDVVGASPVGAAPTTSSFST